MDRKYVGKLMATIANNHFSELAQKGRYGDTEVALSKHVNPGHIWHVNPQEKSLMERGVGGERLVDAIGSGTINPETGLEEKFEPVTITAAGVTAAAAVGSMIIGAIGGAASGSAAETQARYDQDAAQQGLAELNRTEGLLEKGYVSKKAAAQQDYTMGVEKLSAETGIAKEDLSQQHSDALQKSGLVSSAGVEKTRSQLWNRIEGSFGRGSKSLLAGLGKQMGEVEGWYEGEKARISSERLKFKRQKDLAEEQEDAWYLGKNIGKIFGG